MAVKATGLKPWREGKKNNVELGREAGNGGYIYEGIIWGGTGKRVDSMKWRRTGWEVGRWS